MKVVKFLDFLNKAKDLYALDYARCNGKLVNFLDYLLEDEQFTQKIDLGIIYVCENGENKYTIVDGLCRLVSLSLLLHAICECYKKTTSQNAEAIKTIRSKYLYKREFPKLHLNYKEMDIYTKALDGTRLSGLEKSSPIFIQLHKYWTKIKEEKLQASRIFKMLNKVEVRIVTTDEVPIRDLYYSLNSFRELNQLLLIDNYMLENSILSQWEKMKKSCFLEKEDINLFLRDFFITKYDYKKFKNEKLYEIFTNYFETMKKYNTPENILKNMTRTANLYFNILNLNFNNKEIRDAFIKIKKHAGEDTYAYLLCVYEDFCDKNISENTFLEILRTVDEYLKNRQNSGKNIDFNELIQYLNAFITCK